MRDSESQSPREQGAVLSASDTVLVPRLLSELSGQKVAAKCSLLGIACLPCWSVGALKPSTFDLPRLKCAPPEAHQDIAAF